MDFVLSQVVKGGQAVSIDEKVEKAGEMLGFIAKLPSGIERDYYLKKTAEALDMDETVLRQEMPKLTKGPAHHRAEEKSPTTASRSHKPKAEEILVHLMLKDEVIARDLRQLIQPQDFTDPLYRRAAKRIFEALGANTKFSISSLMTEGDEELNNLISHYSVLEMNYDDPEKSGRDCVALIKQRDPEKKMKSLIKEIREADARGDRATLTRLIEEQKELSKRPGRRIYGM
jgi:DNA primase